MMKKTVDLSIKARYFIKPSEAKDGKIKYCWLVAHGYGQLAEYFIKHFEVLSENHKVIAPEGLHRFYLEGTNGRVGATWMTKLEREQDIAHYTNFLESVMKIECSEDVGHTIAFGFSQGAATISRWLCVTNFQVNTLVLWAGAWPHDMPIEHNLQTLKSLKIIVVVGIQDQYLGDEGIEKYLSDFDKNDIDYELIRFEGDHRLDKYVLRDVSEKIESL